MPDALMRHYRPQLDRSGRQVLLRIADLADIADELVMCMAGWPISAQ